MAKIVKKLTDLVGNTPLMELSGYCGKYGMEQKYYRQAGSIQSGRECEGPGGSFR